MIPCKSLVSRAIATDRSIERTSFARLRNELEEGIVRAIIQDVRHVL